MDTPLPTSDLSLRPHSTQVNQGDGLGWQFGSSSVSRCSGTFGSAPAYFKALRVTCRSRLGHRHKSLCLMCLEEQLRASKTVSVC